MDYRRTSRHISFKSAINITLRASLESGTNQERRPYHEKTRDLGVQPGIDLTKALHMAAALEDVHTIHKLEPRK